MATSSASTQMQMLNAVILKLLLSLLIPLQYNDTRVLLMLLQAEVVIVLATSTKQQSKMNFKIQKIFKS